jgi:parallel beta-helix repeat protein
MGGPVLKKKIASFVLCLILILSTFIILDFQLEIIEVVEGETLYVNTTGSNGVYTSIQDAINASSDGDTVFVYSGTYSENILFNQTINLTGENRDTTIIDGGRIGDVINISVNWANITGFTVTGSDSNFGDAGIELYNVHNCSIINNNISNNWAMGIYLFQSIDNRIKSNTVVSNSGHGIYLDHSSSVNLLSANNVSSNNGGGIVLSSSSNNNIIGNNISNNGYGVSLYLSSNSYIIDNNVSNNFFGFQLDSSSNNVITNNSIFSSDWAGIELESSSNNNITWNNVSLNKDYGIILYSSSNNNFVIDNNVSNNRLGIVLGSSSGNNITRNNVISNGEWGIYLDYSSENIVIKNDIIDSLYGIYIWSSLNNNLTGNEVSNCDYGIYLGKSSNNNNIIGNNVTSSKEYGIIFCLSSNYNVININNISNNMYGIFISSSSNNNITCNDFVNDGIFIVGDQLPHYNSHHIPTNNVVNGKPLYYHKDCSGLNIDGISVGQLILANCTNINVKNLKINNTDIGIEIAYTSDAKITSNDILNNDYGFYLVFSSNNQIISNNISTNNEWGTYIKSSSNNQIYHNNFIENTFQAYDDNSNNFWNDFYPSGGNYWSDYSGLDAYKGPNQDIIGSDRIGDTSYFKDRYPLMGFYKPLENYTILHQGWNIISIPTIQEEQNLTRVLGSINSWYDAVQWYDSSDKIDPWKHNRIGKSFGNDLFELNETMGFWVHVTHWQEIIFAYNGTSPTENQTILLNPGWNMVGYPFQTSYNRTDGLNNLTFDNQVDAIWTYDASSQKWIEMGESDYFELGKGYYIHARTKCEWEVPL